MSAPTVERVFDASCVFLLTLGYENLYEPVGGEMEFRCKGCGAAVQRRERQKHHEHHRRTHKASRQDTNGGSTMATLELDRKVVTRIVKAIDNGKGLTTVAAELNADKVPVPGRAKTWYAPTVRNIYLRETGKTSIKQVRKQNPLATKAAAKTTAKSSTAKPSGKQAKPDPKPGKASSRTTRGRRSTTRKRSR